MSRRRKFQSVVRDPRAALIYVPLSILPIFSFDGLRARVSELATILKIVQSPVPQECGMTPLLIRETQEK